MKRIYSTVYALEQALEKAKKLGMTCADMLYIITSDTYKGKISIHSYDEVGIEFNGKKKKRSIKGLI